MLINAITESSKTHFKDESGDDNFINTKKINYSKKTIPILRKRNSCAITREQYPLANKMKETDYDSATPSLQQEMNLARRACWCNNNNSKSNNNNLTITDKMHKNNLNVIITNSNNDKQNKSCEICCCNAKTTIGYDNVNNVDDDNVVSDVTTVLNGATFSKNINKCNSINYNIEIDANNDGSDNNDHVDYDNAVMKNVNDNIDNSNDDCSSETLATINLSNTNSESHLIKRKNSPITTPTSTTTAITEIPADLTKCIENIQCSGNQIPAAVNFVSYARVLILKFWLTLAAFCDTVTIRHDDPRFIEARKKEQQQREQQQEERKRPKDPGATTTKPAQFKFKLLTSKKVIFLFFICLFFSCVNRIEGRPNTSNEIAPNDAAAAAVTAKPTAAPTVPAAVAAGVGEIVPAKLAITPSSNDDSSSMVPPRTNAISQDIAIDDDISLPTEAPHVIELSAHDEEVLHKAERYPLSQVDFDRVKTPFIIGIWILSASIAKIGFHMTPKLHLIFPESILLIVVGVAIGVVLYFGTEVAVSPLTPNTFFFYMLPPIILDAGYFMPNRMFFDNLGTILLMAVVGTIFNIATIGGSLYACGLAGIFGSEIPKFLDIFLFASLISAVDPVAVLAVFEEIHVNEILYIVVFGESLLNDAVTVVMYHMMEVYNEIGISEIMAQDVISGVGSFFVVAVGGTVIGIIWGFLTGLVTRFTDHVRVIEPIFIFVMAYLAYLNAEIFHMSGILAITFCGITMKNYVESNISQKSHTTVKYALKMLSSSSETIIFMFLGVATVNNQHVWNTAFVVLTIAFCSVFRVIGVIILSAMANRFRLHKLSRVDQFVMSYGGLRGAVAFALVLLVDERVVKQKDMFVTTTIAVIYFTVFVQGITIKPLVKFLNVKRANKRKPSMNERIHERFMDHLMAGIEDIVGKTGNYNVRDKFKRFDNRFIRPLLLRDLKGAEPKIIETYSKLTMRDAMEVMRRNPSTIGQITATESMSALFRNYTNNCIGGRWAPPTIYTTCPSLTNLDNSCSRNLDMHELDYNPSKKDLTDAKIHHLLAEELKPYRRHRRLSYSRHAVDDRDLSTRVNYKMQMNFRRMFNDRKHHKRSKRGTNKPQEGVKQNHVSFHDFQQNGTTKQFTHDYINDVLNESAEENPSRLNEVTVVGANDEWDDNDGLTFTAKSSPDSDRANNNSLIAHIQNLPGFDASKARIVQHYAHKSSDCDSSSEKMLTPDTGPTAAELILPWRRDRSYQSIVAENPIPEEDRNVSRDSDGERRVATPTALESQLPWKRQGDETISDAVQQNEFPAWASNKEYLAYNSPSATFLGGINKPKQPKSVIGLFRRESSGSRGGSSLGGGDITDIVLPGAGSARGSDPTLAAALGSMIVVPSSTQQLYQQYPNPRLDKRSQSISAASPSRGGVGDGHSGPFPVTASHRRNVRRGSMLELTGDIIPEETYQHGHSKSLCEPAGEDWNSAALTSHERADSASGNSGSGGGHEPLLPRFTPRAQIRRLGGGAGGGRHQVTSALLSTSNSEYDDDEDEDFDLYDDDNIVVTTTTLGGNGGGSNGGGSSAGLGGAAGGISRSRSGSGGAAAAANTITTIRLTRNSDESII